MCEYEQDEFYAEIRAEQEAAHLREIQQLSDLAFVFLYATNGHCRFDEAALEEARVYLYPSSKKSAQKIFSRLQGRRPE